MIAVKEYFLKLISFSGRGSRSEYFLFNVLLPTVLILTLALFLARNFPSNLVPDYVFFIISPLAILFIWLSLSVTVRRLHDINLSGWWILLNPLLSLLLVLFLCLKRGSEGVNRFDNQILDMNHVNESNIAPLTPEIKNETYDISGRTNNSKEASSDQLLDSQGGGQAAKVSAFNLQRYSLEQRGVSYWTRTLNAGKSKKESPVIITIIVITLLLGLYILGSLFIKDASHKQVLPHQSIAYSPLIVNALKNLTYPTIYETVTLKDGGYNRDSLVDIKNDIHDRLSVTFADHAFGDLDGDGNEDAAVVLVANGGGSGHYFYLIPVFNVGGEPKVFNSGVELGDRISLEHIGIREGRVTVQIITQGPDDPLCCPTKSQSLDFYVDSKKLHPHLGIFERMKSLSSSYPVVWR
jgi:uncharacterized membrane protein YhaH (DUF805 family)